MLFRTCRSVSCLCSGPRSWSSGGRRSVSESEKAGSELMSGRSSGGTTCGMRGGMVSIGEGTERRALRIADVQPRRRGKGRVGGDVCGVNVVSSGGILGSGIEIKWVEIEGN